MPPSHQEGNHADWPEPGRFATSSLDPDTETDIRIPRGAGGKLSQQPFCAQLATGQRCPDKPQTWFCFLLGQAGHQMVASSGLTRVSHCPEAVLPPLFLAAKHRRVSGSQSDWRDMQDLITPSPQTINEGELQQERAPFTLTEDR